MKILTVIIIALVVIYAVVIIYNIYYKQNKIEIVGRSSFICNKLKNIYFEYPIFKGPQKNTIICGDPKAQEQSEIEIIQRSDAGYSWLTTFITLENIANSSLPNLQKNKNNIPYLLNLEEKELRFVVSDNKIVLIKIVDIRMYQPEIKGFSYEIFLQTVAQSFKIMNNL